MIFINPSCLLRSLFASLFIILLIFLTGCDSNKSNINSNKDTNNSVNNNIQNSVSNSKNILINNGKNSNNNSNSINSNVNSNQNDAINIATNNSGNNLVNSSVNNQNTNNEQNNPINNSNNSSSANLQNIECDHNNDCSETLICINNKCKPECEQNRPCEGYEICRNGVCEPECNGDFPCSENMVCREGNCEPECDNEHECSGSLICKNNICEPECTDSVQCEDNLICKDEVCIESDCVVDFDCEDPLKVCESNECKDPKCGTYIFIYRPSGNRPDTVSIAGTFNGWSTTLNLMSFVESQNIFYAKVDVGDGIHFYKFVINGSEWRADPENPDADSDGNSKITISCPVNCEPESVNSFDWRDGVMYFAMVDRFYNSDGNGSRPDDDGSLDNPRFGYGGGDLKGVTDKLSYLSQLGVTVLWLSAPNKNGALGYHGYWPAPVNTNYSNMDQPDPRPQVDTHFGTEQDLRDLISTAHNSDSANSSGIKVIFDYILNHVHDSSELYRNNQHWFYLENGYVRTCDNGTPDVFWDDLWEDDYYGTRCGFNGFLPPFNFDDNNDALNWSINDAVWWAKEYNIDGYRLDAIKHVPLKWLTGLRSQLNNTFSSPSGGRFFLVGETYDHNREILKKYVDPNTKLDGQFDFPFQANLCDAVIKRSKSMSDFVTWLDENDGYYGSNSIMTNWIGNHDIPRIIHNATGEIDKCGEGSNNDNNGHFWFSQPQSPEPYEKLSVAFAVMMTSKTMPLIYYGDEIGLAGGGDPENRRMMIWENNALNSHQIELRENVQFLARLRGQYKSISRGKRITHDSDNDTWVYSLKTGCADIMPELLIAINRSDFNKNIIIPQGNYMDLKTGTPKLGGSLQMSARSYVVYEYK